jgi:UDP-GlcNAc3NAcA epimerase
MLEQIEGVLQKEKPAMTLVYGDTNSTLAGALASVKLHIPVAHVEAGLRSFDMKMPEEINRIVTDRVSKVLFCPTATAVKNLVTEGYGEAECTIVQAGDVMYDTLLYYKDKAIATSTLVKKLGLEPGGFALATIHQAENTDHPQRLHNITEALLQINETMPVVWPIHPRTRKKIGAMTSLEKLTLIEPTGYFDMLSLLNHARLVLTDSGGLQKEAYMMKKFCITLRDQTEWTELVSARVNVIASHDKEKIAGAFSKLKDKTFPAHEDLYGDGQAAQVIVDHILQNTAL